MNGSVLVGYCVVFSVRRGSLVLKVMVSVFARVKSETQREHWVEMFAVIFGIFPGDEDDLYGARCNRMCLRGRKIAFLRTCMRAFVPLY